MSCYFPLPSWSTGGLPPKNPMTSPCLLVLFRLHVHRNPRRFLHQLFCNLNMFVSCMYVYIYICCSHYMFIFPVFFPCFCNIHHDGENYLFFVTSSNSIEGCFRIRKTNNLGFKSWQVSKIDKVDHVQLARSVGKPSWFAHLLVAANICLYLYIAYSILYTYFFACKVIPCPPVAWRVCASATEDSHSVAWRVCVCECNRR